MKLISNLVLYVFKDRNRMIQMSISDMVNQERVERGDKIAVIILIAVITFVFFAPNLQMMLFFLFSGLIIGFLHLKGRNRK